MRLVHPRAISVFCFLMVLIGSALALIAGRSFVPKTHAVTATPVFQWSMPKRFGARQPDGMPDFHWNEHDRTYSDDYVHPGSWTVQFNACSPNAGAGTTFSWEVDGAPLPNPNPTTCTLAHDFTAQGSHLVKLTLTAPDGAQASVEAPIVVKDLLIVSLGDSFASGQGSPDMKKHGSIPARWVDHTCARSSLAGPAQAARSIEEADPHTSVTFLSFACSGATVNAGLLGPQQKGNIVVPAQVSELKQALRGRPIDALLISIGGNDIGFAELVARCIVQINCHQNQQTVDTFNHGLDGLEALYQSLSDKLADLPPITRTFITEYPDLVRDGTGELCHKQPTFDLLRGITHDEAEWASQTVISSLNQKIGEAATKHSWTYVSGVSDRFRTHGYCAPDKVRWVNTFHDAKRIQGADKQCDVASFISSLRQCLISSGTVHPSEGGYATYASRIIESLQTAGVVTPPGP